MKKHLIDEGCALPFVLSLKPCTEKEQMLRGFPPDDTVYHRLTWSYAAPWPDEGGWIDNSKGMPMVRFEFRIALR